MLKKELIDLLSADVVARNTILHVEHPIYSVTTNLQTAKHEDVVFYKVSKDEKSQADFHKRLAQGNPGLIILNREAEAYIKVDNCIFMSSSRFLSVQQKLLDHFCPNKNIMKLIGVTGTNGKTTTVNLAMQISTMIEHPAISVGTIGVHDANGALIDDTESTTPSYVEFRRIIHKYQDKYDACFVEVSSHALEQGRLNDLMLDAAAWTSFSQDHLDYHKTMEDYFKAKLLVESKYLKLTKYMVLPKNEKKMHEKILKINPNAKIMIAKTLDERGMTERPLFYQSSYNQSNVEVALQLNANLWGEENVQMIDIKKIQTPKGRFSIIELEHESMAIVDYAHTPDALINIGEAIRKAFPTHSLTVIFGCGGNRDKTKRSLMGKAVSTFADKIIVTSDNPRDEAPEDIVMDIIAGITTGYEAVVDRKKAILHALESIRKKEIILIAGKGHEEYQEIRGVKHSFSDFKIVENFKRG